MRFKKDYSFDEKKDAEDIIEHGFPEGKINYGDMQKVAKYFRNVSGFGQTRLERELIKFCKEQDESFNPIVERESIKKWIKSAMTNTLRKVNEIVITEPEVEVIKKVKDLKHRKILFATLIIAKAIKQGKTSIAKKESTSEKYYIQYGRFMDIIRLAKVQITEVQLCDILHNFVEEGLIELYNPEREVISLSFVNNYAPKVFSFLEPEKFNDYYNQYFNGKIIYCKTCGKEMVKKANNHTRCDECAYKAKLSQNATWKKKQDER